jgi:hypothetical protein
MFVAAAQVPRLMQQFEQGPCRSRKESQENSRAYSTLTDEHLGAARVYSEVYPRRGRLRAYSSRSNSRDCLRAISVAE